MASYNAVAQAPPPPPDSYESDLVQPSYPDTYVGGQTTLPEPPAPPAYGGASYGDTATAPLPEPATDSYESADLPESNAYAPESEPYAAATGAPATPPGQWATNAPSAAYGLLTEGYRQPAVTYEPHMPDAEPCAPLAPVPPASAAPTPASALYTPAPPAPAPLRTPAGAKVAPAPPSDGWEYAAGGASRSYPTLPKGAAAQKKEEQYYRRALTDALAAAEYETTGVKAGYSKGGRAKIPKPTSVRDVELQLVLKYAFYRDPTDEEITKVKSRLGAADEYRIDNLVKALKEEEPAYGLPETKLLRRQDHIFRAWHGGLSRKQVFEAMAQHTKLFKIANAMLAVLAVVVLVLSSWQLARLDSASADSVVLVLCSSLVIASSIVGLYGISRLEKDLQRDEDGKETTAQREPAPL